MPERILRPGILTSERVNALSANAEVFYRRLMSKVDDFARYDARPAVLRAEMYAFQLDRVSEQLIRECLAECENSRLLRVYVVDGKPYLELFDFRQRMRAERSKWPAPACTMPANAMSLPCERVTMPSESESETNTETGRKAVPAPGELGRIAEEIYEAYPRRVKKLEALREIIGAIKLLAGRGFDSGWLLDRTKQYAAARVRANHRFTPNPDNWFREGRYDDDPATWLDSEMPANGGPVKSPASVARDQERAEATRQETSVLKAAFAALNEKYRDGTLCAKDRDDADAGHWRAFITSFEVDERNEINRKLKGAT